MVSLRSDADPGCGEHATHKTQERSGPSHKPNRKQTIPTSYFSRQHTFFDGEEQELRRFALLS